MAKDARNERIYSTYLDELENALVKETARVNGTSPNSVIRVAVRKMLGMPAVLLAPPPELDELWPNVAHD